MLKKLELIKIIKRKGIAIYGELILLSQNDYGEVYGFDSNLGKLIIKVGFKEGEEAKIPGLGCHRLQNEIFFNAYLGKNKLIPKITGVGGSKAPIRYSYLLYKQTAGDNLAHLVEKNLINLPRLKAYYFSMGQKLKTIHKIKLNHFGPLGGAGKPISWYDFFSGVLDECLIHMESGEFSKNIPLLKKYIEKNISLFKEAKIIPKLLHGDYEPWNIIVKDNKIKSIIDGEFAFGGHNLIDLVPDTPSNFREANKKILKTSFIKGYFGTKKPSEWELKCLDFYKNIKMITHRMVVWEFFTKSAGKKEALIERKKINLMLKEIKNQILYDK